MVERDHGVDAGGEQAVDQAVVVVQSGGGRLTAPAGLHARPRHREAVAVRAETTQQVDVLAPPVEAVGSRLAGDAAPDAVGLRGEGVPDRGATLGDGALDLPGRGRDPEPEPRRQLRNGGRIGHGTILGHDRGDPQGFGPLRHPGGGP